MNRINLIILLNCWWFVPIALRKQQILDSWFHRPAGKWCNSVRHTRWRLRWSIELCLSHSNCFRHRRYPNHHSKHHLHRQRGECARFDFLWSIYFVSFRWPVSSTPKSIGKTDEQTEWTIASEIDSGKKIRWNMFGIFQIRFKTTIANVFHFSSNNRWIMPPSSISKCSSLVPFKIINSAEFQSRIGKQMSLSEVWIEMMITQLVLPSGSSVSNAFSGYPEHVMLLYRQNSRADSSNISRNTSALPSLLKKKKKGINYFVKINWNWRTHHASVSGVNPAALAIPFLAGNFGWRSAYPNISFENLTLLLLVQEIRKVIYLPVYRIRLPCAESCYQTYLEHLDRRYCLSANCKHSHLHSKHSMLVGIRRDMLTLRSQYFSPDCFLAGHVARRNFLVVENH